MPRPARAPEHRSHGLPPEIAFLAACGISPSWLMDAAERARQQGVTADRLLIAEGLIEERRFYRHLAHHLGVRFSTGRITFADPATYRLAFAAGRTPVIECWGTAWVCAPQGHMIAHLLQTVQRGSKDRGRIILVTPTHYARDLRDSAAHCIAADASEGLTRSDAGLSAATEAKFIRRRLFHVIALVSAITALFVGATPLASVSLFATAVLLAALIARLLVCGSSCISAADTFPVTGGSEDLPVYSVLVPLHREERILADLVEALRRLAYPAAKLDIKIIIESDDHATRRALDRMGLEPRFDVIVAPPGIPRTKPRALNVALPFVRGTFVTVYDAEDEPDADQIRRAVATFSRMPAQVACLQARLAIRNISSGWLTRMFALEYAALFDVMNVGLGELAFPIALGGSSNHFRTAALRAVGGWDAWNVTEDADLGFRLARFGYRTAMLASTTSEEAPRHLGNWFGQRRRWFKGWLQTTAVLLRSPLRVWRDLKTLRTLELLLTLVALVITPLAWPPGVVLLAYELATVGIPQPTSIVDIARDTLWTSIAVAGSSLGIFATLLGMKRRGLARLWPHLPLLIVYHALISAAAWVALYDFVRRPVHWRKTEHGLADRDP